MSQVWRVRVLNFGPCLKRVQLPILPMVKQYRYQHINCKRIFVQLRFHAMREPTKRHGSVIHWSRKPASIPWKT